MIRLLETALVLVVAVTLLARDTPAQTASFSSEPFAADTVHVAPPTGETEADRASILAALEAVEPGGTVLFAPGTYLIGDFVRVEVPGVTLQGHPDRTILRGCDPENYPEYRVQLGECNGLELAAGHVTIRGLTIDHAWHGIYIGCCFEDVAQSFQGEGEGPPREQPGGHLIADNRLRTVGTAMRVIGQSSEPIVIRDNVFRNVAHALVVNGGTAHVLDNDIAAPEPELVPAGAYPIGAIGVFPAPPARECGPNVIAGNRIEGHPDGIGLAVGVPGTRCEGNVVRDNDIVVRGVSVRDDAFELPVDDASDSTVVGIAIDVGNLVGEGGPPVPSNWAFEGETSIGGHLIEDNRITGADGLAIEIRRSSGNRIVGNTIIDVEPREPFPGLVANSADPEAWREANGSAVWISPGSDENQILDNAFEDLAGAAVFLEGDVNQVITRSPEDEVRDRGIGNRATVRTEGSDADSPVDRLPRFEPDECPFNASGIDVETLECGYLSVPESRERDDGRTLRLAVAVAEPRDATDDPVVLLPGGPGGGPLPGFISRVRGWIPPDRTLVVFDPRGTGYSGPVMCPELGATYGAIAAMDVALDESRPLRRGAELACRDRLLRRGIDLEAYNSAAVAHDLRDLREALGYERWNLLAASYGVPFARAVMRLDPDGVRSAVLAIGPTQDLAHLLTRDVPFFARALERVFEGCTARASCRERYPDVQDELYRTYESLRERPLTVPVSAGEFRSSRFTVNAHDYVRAVYAQLWSESDVPYIPALIRAFRDRDTAVVREVVEREFGGFGSDFSWGMMYSVDCYDAHTPESWSDFREAAVRFPPALAEIEFFLRPCDDWSDARASSEERAPLRSSIPTLVLDGEFDPASPPVIGEESLRGLSEGHHVTIPGMGHMPAPRSEPCWASLIQQFFERPGRRPDAGCTDELPEVEILPDLPPWARPPTSGSADPDTVRVDPPTGEEEADRPSILAALDEVEPGGTVLFAPGTYVTGDFIEVPVPEITLVGHPEGTTLRGCEPEELVEPGVPRNGLQLTESGQTVRDFTFEHISHALWVGCCLTVAESGYGPEGPHVGGHLIEGNTIRATWNGVRVIGDSPDPVVIRDNDFVDTWHAAVVNGRTAHIVDNRISVPEPERVPINAHPGLAMSITPFDTALEHPFTCAGNVVAGNRIEGHPDGIAIQAFRSGAACRENVIRGNTIVVSRVRVTPPSWGVIGDRSEADSTLAGVPLSLGDLSAEMAARFPRLPDDAGDEELVHDNLIEGNHILGAEGVAIEFLRASRNRVVDNTITGVTARDPFPGNTLMFSPGWSDANGTAIWISPDSDGNEIAGNTFEDVAAHAVVLEGDSNRVELRSADDAVRDLGADNHVSVADDGGR